MAENQILAISFAIWLSLFYFGLFIVIITNKSKHPILKVFGLILCLLTLIKIVFLILDLRPNRIRYATPPILSSFHTNKPERNTIPDWFTDQTPIASHTGYLHS